MKFETSKRAIIAIALFLITAQFTSAQETESEQNPFAVFNEYKQWGITFSPRLYAKAKTRVVDGNYDIDTNNSFGLGLGFDYLFFPKNKFSFRAGARISFFSPESFNVYIPADELTPWRDQPIDEHLRDLAILFSVPLDAEWKYPLSNKTFLSLRAGVEIFFYETHEASTGLLVDPDISDSNEMFFILNKTSKNSIQPYLKFSPGVYFVLNPFILQTSLIYQKNLNTFHKGTFNFSNLAQSNSGTGTSNYSGDFIGLELTFFLKKKK
jgi:hypothetical protein